ncbi:CIC11C00000003163 [Sungouiella intermedia]|uniref:CIC11C00000003163 n=1 Tax=Sungouiella intermedia TaxID=45354 RepID=A0A1L0DVY2_9ASCO|nr:CIC11C00000003163 [[Candida] intermedia]
MEDDTVQSLLPKCSLECPPVTVGSTPQLTKRTKVEFMVKSVNPSFFSKVIYTNGEFAFDPDFTIQQAAKYAASNYPQSSLAPVFSEVWGFKKAAPTYQIVVIDSNANVHSMFREDDILIVSNVPNIKDVQRKENTNRMLLVFSPFIAFFLFMILMGVLHG